uniref:Rhodanese domain-containing protein n=1 Tax=Eptatretus burgeri TaxID=7764 RepID=A0A8C4WV80_EPTBU
MADQWYGLPEDLGSIPGLVDNLEEALSFSEHEFMALYGTRPPGQNHKDIIFICRAGRRSRNAIEIATIRGYDGVAGGLHAFCRYMGWTDQRGQRVQDQK